MCVVSLREEVMKRDERVSRRVCLLSLSVCVCVPSSWGATRQLSERASDTRTMTAAPFCVDVVVVVVRW